LLYNTAANNSRIVVMHPRTLVTNDALMGILCRLFLM
jgi:hypothetical protein